MTSSCWPSTSWCSSTRRRTGMLSEPERVPHTAESPWLVAALDIDGDGIKDLVILDTAGEQPIHIRFATPEKKLGPEQRFAVEVPRAVAFGAVDDQPGSEILDDREPVGPGAGADARPLGRATRRTERGRLAFFALPQGNERGRSLALGDLDGDGRQDVVVTDPSNAQVWAYLQIGTLGPGRRADLPQPGRARTRPPRRPRRRPQGRGLRPLRPARSRSAGARSPRGRLSFPTPLPIVGEPVAMDLADLDGDKVPEILYVARTRPSGPRASSCAALARDKSDVVPPLPLGRPGVDEACPAVKVGARRRSSRWTSTPTARPT